MALSEIISTIEDIKRDIQNQQKQISLFKKSNQNNISRVQTELKGGRNNHDKNMLKALTDAASSLKKAETALQQAEKSATQAARI